MSSVAVIGAGGFVGSRLIEHSILTGGPGTRAVVRSYRNLAALCQYGSLTEIRRADAESVPALSEALAGCSVAVNVTTGPPAGIVRSTKAIHAACRQAGVRRLVHLSSAVVHGDMEAPLVDDDPPVERHWMPYARAKGAAERWLREQITSTALDLVVLRPGIVWGPRSPHTLAIGRALRHKSAFLVGDGSGVFNGIYIDNLVTAILTAAQTAEPATGFYNVGDSETITWRILFEALGRALGCDPARLPRVAAERFPPSVGSTIDWVQSLGPVNLVYHRLKSRIPDGLKARIRAQLEGDYRYDAAPTDYVERAAVGREEWHLQRTRRKPPTAKFSDRFNFTAPVSFAEGVSRTLSWLADLGMCEERKA